MGNGASGDGQGGLLRGCLLAVMTLQIIISHHMAIPYVALLRIQDAVLLLILEGGGIRARVCVAL
jgi:hypothetical protein